VQYKISASLVIYNSKLESVINAAESFLNGCENGILIISDNSQSPLIHPLLENPRVLYMFNNANIGFGAAHNKAFFSIGNKTDFHLILNPDVIFLQDVIPHILKVMQDNREIGVLMPRVNYPDGSLQRLCKLLPTPFNLILRRFIPIPALKKYINRSYELHDLAQDKLIDVPTISGCFLIFQSQLFRSIGGFDERYFMYLEDIDLVRRIGALARIVYDPRVSVIHEYARGSYKNNQLLKYHIKSAVLYFAKWGWFFDSQRKEINAKMKMGLKNLSKISD
jgi:GT2 family glycosyltransferase